MYSALVTLLGGLVYAEGALAARPGLPPPGDPFIDPYNDPYNPLVSGVHSYGNEAKSY